MTFSLLSNWRTVLAKAWSVKLIAFATVLDGLAAAVPYLQETLGLPIGTFAALSGVVSALALLARLFVQNEIPAKEDTPATLAIDTPDEVTQ
jgi:hypothetical protein